MADFYPAAQQLQYPDMLAAYVRGQQAPLDTQLKQQAVTEGALKMDQLRQIMALSRQLSGQGAQNQGGGGIQNGPQGQVSSQPPSPSGSFDGSVGPPVNTMMALDVLQGRDPLKSAEAAQTYELKQRQLQAQAPLATLDSIAASASPARVVMNNQGLIQRWTQLAPQLGFDPVKDFNDDNVRSAIGFARNQIAGAAGLPTKESAPPMQTVQGPLGSIYQTDPVTHKITQVKAEEPLKDVIDPATGQPTNVRASQAEGKQPFNPSIFGAANLSDQAVQFAADTYRTTGKMPAAFGRNPAMQAKVLDKVAADAQAAGDTTGAIAARSASLKANSMALDQATKLESATSSYYNTLDKNLTNLLEQANKTDSTGSPLINRAVRNWQQNVTTDPETAKLVTWLNAVQGEYAKIKSGSLGNVPASDAAMKDAKETINKFMSQGGMAAVAEAMRGEGNNRLSSLREQKQQLVGALGQNAPGLQSPTAGNPPARNPQGWVLHTDAKGNKAYVSPDGKQFQEVR